jgi:hypothetical protein
LGKNKAIILVSGEEADQVSRSLLRWLNEYPDKPVSRIGFEYLDADELSMTLSTIQSAYKTKQYILGGYEAQYQFKLVYRVQPGRSTDERLAADEALNALADWATNRKDMPDIGTKRKVLKIISDSRSSLFARYDDGSEDHQILMKLTYEVSV